MDFLTIIGWIAVVWLLGSFLYSSKFHIKNYLLRKQRIKAGEPDTAYERLHKELNYSFLKIVKIGKNRGRFSK